MTDCLSRGSFRVLTSPAEHSIVTVLSGKLRRYNVRVLRGDNVICEVSPYDMSKGRIIQRLISRPGRDGSLNIAPGSDRDVDDLVGDSEDLITGVIGAEED